MKGLLAENGQTSSMRVMTLGVVFAIVGTWVYVSVVKTQLQPIDMNQVLMLVSAMGFKVWQKDKENVK